MGYAEGVRLWLVFKRELYYSTHQGFSNIFLWRTPTTDAHQTTDPQIKDLKKKVIDQNHYKLQSVKTTTPIIFLCCSNFQKVW